MKEYKGQLAGFPEEIVNKMLDNQVLQGNKINVGVFEENNRTNALNDGFDWDKSPEGKDFWRWVINKKEFDTFFETYPKKSEKKIIGYEIKELKKIKDSVNAILNNAYPQHKIGFLLGSKNHKLFSDLDVLDIWFDQIYEEEKKETIFKMHSEQGEFELVISKEGILYKDDGAYLDSDSIKSMINVSKGLNFTRESQLSIPHYQVNYKFVDVGCKKNTHVEEWRKVLEIYKSYQK